MPSISTPLLLLPCLAALCVAIPNLAWRSPTLCTTLAGEKCIFPFRYEGVVHYQCTHADSPAPWCATQVHSNGTTVTDRWGDCSLGALSRCSVEETPDFVISVGDEVAEISSSQESLKPLSTTTTPATTTITPSTTTITPSTSTPPPILATAEEDGECLTVSGPAAGRPCVFPFTYSGKTYSTCTQWIFSGDNQGKLWCSTKTDGLGLHINGEGHYGFCTPGCGPNSIPLTGANARESNSVDAVVFREELPIILEYPK